MSVTVVGRDHVGTVAVDETGFAYYLTACCGASAKGMANYVGCRSCHREVDPALGGTPNRDILTVDGKLVVVEKPMYLAVRYGDGLPYDMWKAKLLRGGLTA